MYEALSLAAVRLLTASLRACLSYVLKGALTALGALQVAGGLSVTCDAVFKAAAVVSAVASAHIAAAAADAGRLLHLPL